MRQSPSRPHLVGRAGRMGEATRRRRQRGQGLSEYAILLGLVAVLVIGALSFAGGTIAKSLTDTGAAIGSLQASDPPPTKAPKTPKPTKAPKTPKPTKAPKTPKP